MPQAPNAQVRGPGDERTSENADREPCYSATSPASRDSKENHRQVKGPGEQKEPNLRVQDPGRPVFNERPDHSRHRSDRDKNKTGIHRLSNDSIQGRKRR